MSLEALELLFDEIIRRSAVCVPFSLESETKAIRELLSVIDLKSDLKLM